MKIKALGTGGAFSTKYGNSQLLLDTGDPKTSLLFDCGRTTFENLKACGEHPGCAENIYISHTHSDHIGGLPDLGLFCYFVPEMHKPKLYAKRSITKVLWNNYLAVMMETLASGQLPKGKSLATFQDYFDVKPINDNKSFSIGNILYNPVQTIHVVNGTEFMDSYGLLVNLLSGKKILLTGDIQFAPHQMNLLYEEADIIIHDCETSSFKSGVHAHIDDLRTLSSEVKGKMHLIHYGDNIDEIDTSEFASVLKPGDSLEIN